MLIGYARVSTQDQNLELQTEALAKAGHKKVFADRISGSRSQRPGLARHRNRSVKVTRWSYGNSSRPT
jgi:DNA invertase Pin-like site-specific DNA recombinase